MRLNKAVLSVLVVVFILFFTAGAFAEDFSNFPVKGMVTMIDLGAKKCVPCKMMAPILEKMEKAYNGKAHIVFIDVWVVGSYWQVLVGIILIWIALGMLGVEKCSLSGSLLYKLNLKGMFGAFILGLAYGVLSGSCTFGFIAPILAIITVQERVMTGVILIILFGIGHCPPCFNQ